MASGVLAMCLGGSWGGLGTPAARAVEATLGSLLEGGLGTTLGRRSSNSISWLVVLGLASAAAGVRHSRGRTVSNQNQSVKFLLRFRGHNTHTREHPFFF